MAVSANTLEKLEAYQYRYRLGDFKKLAEKFRDEVLEGEYSLEKPVSNLFHSKLQRFSAQELRIIFTQICPWLDDLIRGEPSTQIQARTEDGALTDDEVLEKIIQASSVFPSRNVNEIETLRAINNLALSLFHAARLAELEPSARHALLNEADPRIGPRLAKPQSRTGFPLVDQLPPAIDFDYNNFFGAQGFNAKEIEQVGSIYAEAEANDQKNGTNENDSYQKYLRALNILIFYRLYDKVPTRELACSKTFVQPYQACLAKDAKGKSHFLNLNRPRFFYNKLTFDSKNKNGTSGLDPVETYRSIAKFNAHQKAKYFDIDVYFTDALGFSEDERSKIRAILEAAKTRLVASGASTDENKINNVKSQIYLRALIIAFFKKVYGIIPDQDFLNDEVKSKYVCEHNNVAGYLFFFSNIDDLVTWLNGENSAVDSSKINEIDLNSYLYSFDEFKTHEDKIFEGQIINPDFFAYYPHNKIKAGIEAVETSINKDFDNNSQRIARELATLIHIKLYGCLPTDIPASKFRISFGHFGSFRDGALKKRIQINPDKLQIKTDVDSRERMRDLPMGFDKNDLERVLSKQDIFGDAQQAAIRTVFAALPDDLIQPRFIEPYAFNGKTARLVEKLHSNLAKIRGSVANARDESDIHIVSRAYTALSRRQVVSSQLPDINHDAAKILQVSGHQNLHSKLIREKTFLNGVDNDTRTIAYGVLGVPNVIKMLRSKDHQIISGNPSEYVNRKVRILNNSLEGSVVLRSHVDDYLYGLENKDKIFDLQAAELGESVYHFQYSVPPAEGEKDPRRVYLKIVGNNSADSAIINGSVYDALVRSAKAKEQFATPILAFVERAKFEKNPDEGLKFFKLVEDDLVKGAYILSPCDYRGEDVSGGALKFEPYIFKSKIEKMEEFSDSRKEHLISLNAQARLNRIVRRDFNIVAEILSARLEIESKYLDELVNAVLVSKVKATQLERVVQKQTELHAYVKSLKEELKAESQRPRREVIRDMIQALASFEGFCNKLKDSKSILEFVEILTREGFVENESNDEDDVIAKVEKNKAGDQAEQEVSAEKEDTEAPDDDLRDASLKQLKSLVDSLEAEDFDSEADQADFARIKKSMQRIENRRQESIKKLKYSNLVKYLISFAYSLSLSIEGELAMKEIREQQLKENGIDVEVAHITLDSERGASAGFDLAYPEKSSGTDEQVMVYEQVKTTRDQKDLSSYEFTLRKMHADFASRSMRFNKEEHGNAQKQIYRLTIVNFDKTCSGARIISFDFKTPDDFAKISLKPDKYKTVRMSR